MSYIDIPGFEGLYKINEEGEIISLKRKNPKVLKPGISSKGYKIVALFKDKKQSMKTIHSLLAITYLDKDYIEKDLVVDHIDEDKLNNKLSNLRLVTNRQNITTSKKTKFTGVNMTIYGKYYASIRIGKQRKHLGTYNTPEEASAAYQQKLNKLKSKS
jgi:hypothetical protein